MSKIVILKTNRSYYDSKEAAEYSMTVGELIDELEHHPSDAKIIFSNDRGYTYGTIHEETVSDLNF